MKKLKIILSFLFILFSVFTAFLPCLNNGFVNWDDPDHVTGESAVHVLSSPNLKEIFTSFSSGEYQPITTLSFLLDYHVWKLNAFGYHLTSLILHAVNCLLIFWLIFILTKDIFASLITALLFGIHPLQVEAIGWITQRKTEVYALFFLGSIIAYLYYLKNNSAGKFYFFSLILFILSLLSKPMAVTLPIVLLMVDYFEGRKISKIVFIEKIPFFILSLIFAIIAIYGHSLARFIRHVDAPSLFSNIMIASGSIIFYLQKLFFPVKLSVLYPYHGLENTGLPLFLYSLFALFILIMVIIFSGRCTKKIIFGSSFFLITLLPVLQFVPIGVAIVNDHYAYISSIGIFFIISEGIVWLFSKRLKGHSLARLILLSIITALIFVLFSLTGQRCKVWKNSTTLWNDVLSNYPNADIAYNNRGAEFLLHKQYGMAYEDFVKALSINPDCLPAFINLARVYDYSGKYKEAIEYCSKALEIDPASLEAYELLRALYDKTGNYAKAINIDKEIIKKYPNYALGYCNLCSAYGTAGNLKEAIAMCKKSLEINPDLALAHMKLSVAYFYTKEYAKSIEECRKAMELGYNPPKEFLESLKQESPK